MNPEIAKLGHVEFITPELDASLSFFRDIVGLEEVERTDDSVYLRGARELEHHSLVLTAGDEAKVDHVGWRTRQAEDVDKFARRLEDAGTDVRRIGADEEAGQGEAVRFRLPSGQLFELYYAVDKPDASERKRSRLKNKVYRRSKTVNAQRIDHVTFRAPDPAEVIEWLQTNLGFQVNERLWDDNDQLRGVWSSVTPTDHDLAFTTQPDGRTGVFSHVAFFFDNHQEIFDAAELLYENDIDIDGGPGRHAIGLSNFLYVLDPGSGHRTEFYNGGYLVLDPDWSPADWDRDEFMRDGEWKGAEVYGHGPGRSATTFK